jgi:hypothetical protein
MANNIALTFTVNGVEQTIKTIGELETAIRQAKEELSGLEIGTKEFNDLCSHFFGGERKQEKSYSEEDMKIAFDANIKDWISFKEFIEQFKNK